MTAKLVLPLLALVVLASCALGGTIPTNAALSVRLLAGKEECFYEDVASAGKKVFFHFSVVSGGALDIDASVSGPDGQLVWSADREQESRVLFKAKLPGPHKVCFSNKMSNIAVKTVAFTVQVGDPAEGDKDHKIDPIERSLIHITEGLTEVRNEQSYLFRREQDHRVTVETSNTRVLIWSFAEIGLIVGLGVGQIWYLKNCFEKRRGV